LSLLERLTVLVGVNGSGKTALLVALALFLAGFSGNVRQWGNHPFSHVPKFDVKIGAESACLTYMITGICLAEIDGQKNDAEITFSFDGKKSDENRTIRYDMHEELKKLLAKYEKCGSENLPMPIVAYYASKRSLNEKSRYLDFLDEVKSAGMEKRALIGSYRGFEVYGGISYFRRGRLPLRPEG
jgi:predicted ATP-binding protein involved in virulence